MKKNMVEAISCKQHIGVWGDIMRQLLWLVKHVFLQDTQSDASNVMICGLMM